MASAAKMKEGDEHLKKAESALKTSMFKWKVDNEKAALYYREAIKCYQGCRKEGQEKLLKALVASIQPHAELDDHHTAAAHAEKAAKIYMEEKKDCISQGVELYEQASSFYRLNESFDKSAKVLVTAAKKVGVDGGKPDKCIELLKKACQIIEEENRGATAGEVMKLCVSTALEVDMMDDAMDMLAQQTQVAIKLQENDPDDKSGVWLTDAHKHTLSRIVIHFHKQEYKSAKKVCNDAERDVEGFMESDENDAAQTLFLAYQKGSADDLTAAVKQSSFQYLPNRVARLAKKLQFSDDVLENGGDSDDDGGTGGEVEQKEIDLS